MKYSVEYIRRCREEGDEINYEFAKWMDLINDFVFAVTSCSLLDLPDEMYMMNFENGMKWQEMAFQVVYNAMNPY
jgi:hypothetical protein